MQQCTTIKAELAFVSKSRKIIRGCHHLTVRHVGAEFLDLAQAARSSNDGSGRAEIAGAHICSLGPFVLSLNYWAAVAHGKHAHLTPAGLDSIPILASIIFFSIQLYFILFAGAALRNWPPVQAFFDLFLFFASIRIFHLWSMPLLALDFLQHKLLNVIALRCES